MDIESRRAQMLSVGEERAGARCWSDRGFSSRCLRTVLHPPVTDNGCFGWFWGLEKRVLWRLRARPDAGPTAFMNRNYAFTALHRLAPLRKSDLLEG